MKQWTIQVIHVHVPGAVPETGLPGQCNKREDVHGSET